MYIYIYIERERERHACSSSSHGRKGGAPKDPGLHAAAVSAGAGRLQVRLRVKSCPDLLCQTGFVRLLQSGAREAFPDSD